MYSILYEAKFYSFERKDYYWVSLRKDCIGNYYLFYAEDPVVTFRKDIEKAISGYLLWEDLSQYRGYEKTSSIVQIDECTAEENYAIDRRIV